MSQTPSKTSGLSYKARKKWALIILLVGLPVYIVLAVTLVGLVQRPLEPGGVRIAAEFGIYVGLGILWATPFRFIFKGVGQADPNAETGE